MKNEKDLIKEILEQLKRDKKENWIFLHEACDWKEQKQMAEIYGNLIKKIESLS